MPKPVRKSAEMNTQKRVAMYLRVSTLEQAKEGYWLDTQERLLKAYIESNEDKGWITSESLMYRDEGISGASKVSERPGLSQLKADILSGKIDVLLVWKIDRLFRKTAYLLEFIEFLKQKNVNFVSKNESIDLSSPTGKLVLTLLGAIAEMERDVIAERTSEGKISKAMQGYLVYGKLVPYWYKKVHDGKWNRLTLNPEEAEVVKEMFELFVKEGKGTGEIASILTARGIGTNIDRRLRAGDNLPEKLHKGLFRQTSIVRILRNTTYIGEYVCNKNEHTKQMDEWGDSYMLKTEKPESEWVRIPCEPIVDKKIFEKAQELLDNSKTIRRNRGENHLFTGLLKCAECGRTFNYYFSHKKTGNYRCGGKKKDKVLKENLCSNRDISESKLISLVWTKIELALRSKTEFLKAYENSLKDGSGKSWEETTKIEYADLEAKIANKSRAFKDALRKEIEDVENTEIYRSIAHDLAEEIRISENRKAELKKHLATYEDNRTRVEAVSSKMEELKNHIGNFTLEDKAFFIRELTDVVVLSKTNVGVGYRFEI